MGNPPRMMYTAINHQLLDTDASSNAAPEKSLPSRSYRFRPPRMYGKGWQVLGDPSGLPIPPDSTDETLQQWVAILNDSAPWWQRMLPHAVLLATIGLLGILAMILLTTFIDATDPLQAPLWMSPLFWSYMLLLCATVLIFLHAALCCATPALLRRGAAALSAHVEGQVWHVAIQYPRAAWKELEGKLEATDIETGAGSAAVLKDSIAAELTQLHALHQAGALDEAEFKQAKARVLHQNQQASAPFLVVTAVAATDHEPLPPGYSPSEPSRKLATRAI